MDQQTIERVKQEWGREFERFEEKRHPADFPALPPISADRYTDRDFYALEENAFWTKTWLLAAHVDQFPEAGSYRLWRITGEPILLVRGKDDRIRAFYNTCQHRGGPLVKDECGTVSALSCQYHCWTYDLEGTLKSVPEEHEFPGLIKSDRSLVELRCEYWGNLVFVNRDPDAKPLLESLGPLRREFDDFVLDRIKLFHTVEVPLNCNWKVAIDAFQEVYHIRRVHPHTISAYLDYRSAVFTLYEGGHSRLILPKKTGDDAAAADVLTQGGSTEDPRHEITREGNRSYTVFPNIVTPTAEFQFPFLVFWPTGLDTCEMHVMYLAPEGHEDPESPECQMTIAAFNAVMEEDMSIMHHVQQSMQSRGFNSIPLSYVERRIYQFHEEIDRVIGEDKVPAELRVEPLLQPFLEDW